MPAAPQRESSRPRLPPGERRPGRRAAAAGPVDVARALTLGGLALLVLTAAGLAWWHHPRHDGVQIALLFAAVITVGLAFAFEALSARSARATAALERGLIVAGFLVLLLFVPHDPFFYGDDGTRFADIEALLHHGQLSASRYSLVMPLTSVPVLALGNLVESRTWWASHFNVVVLAIGIAVALRLVRGRVDPRFARRAVLALMFASFLTERMRDYNAEVFTATLVALGIIGLTTGRHPVVWWGAIVVGVVNTPAALAGLVVIAVAEVVRTRRLRYLAPVAAAAAGIMLEAWIRRGGPLTTGYAGDHGLRTVMPYSGLAGFSYPFLLGVTAILFSFGRGLLFFAPGLTLWFDRRTRDEVPGRRAVTMMLLFSGGLILVYAKWWAWYGGISWGPRFFLVATVPASILIATRIQHAGESLRRDAFALLVLILSAWVACAGAIANLDTLRTFCGGAAFMNEQLCWFTPDYSSLWQSVRQFPALTTQTTLAGLYIGIVFAYLAAPLVTGLVRALRPRGSLLAGWRV